MTINLATANRMIDSGRQLAKRKQMKPMTFCVLDENGHIVSAQREAGSSLLRFEIAFAKAWGALGMGRSTRHIKDVLLKERPHVAGAIEAVARGRFIAEYGGVLIHDERGVLQGAIGIAGDSEENDEALALAVISEAGLKAAND